jgi:HPt (histidine-containing phosphotransfer) domain-containing protein
MTTPADAARIREFADGMPGGVRGFVELFVTHTTAAARELRAAVQQGNAADIQAVAHRSIGSSAACGAVRLTQLLREVETAGRDGRLDGIDARVGELEAELSRVHAFLQALGDQEPPPV